MPIIFRVRCWTALCLPTECEFIFNTAQSSRSSHECVINHELKYIGPGYNRKPCLSWGQMVVDIGDRSPYIIDT